MQEEAAKASELKAAEEKDRSKDMMEYYQYLEDKEAAAADGAAKAGFPAGPSAVPSGLAADPRARLVSLTPPRPESAMPENPLKPWSSPLPEGAAPAATDKPPEQPAAPPAAEARAPAQAAPSEEEKQPKQPPPPPQAPAPGPKPGAEPPSISPSEKENAAPKAPQAVPDQIAAISQELLTSSSRIDEAINSLAKSLQSPGPSPMPSPMPARPAGAEGDSGPTEREAHLLVQVTQMQDQMMQMEKEILAMRQVQQASASSHAAEVDALVAQVLPLTQYLQDVTDQFGGLERRVVQAETKVTAAVKVLKDLVARPSGGSVVPKSPGKVATPAAAAKGPAAKTPPATPPRTPKSVSHGTSGALRMDAFERRVDSLSSQHLKQVKEVQRRHQTIDARMSQIEDRLKAVHGAQAKKKKADGAADEDLLFRVAERLVKLEETVAAEVAQSNVWRDAAKAASESPGVEQDLQKLQTTSRTHHQHLEDLVPLLRSFQDLDSRIGLMEENISLSNDAQRRMESKVEEAAEVADRLKKKRGPQDRLADMPSPAELEALGYESRVSRDAVTTAVAAAKQECERIVGQVEQRIKGEIHEMARANQRAAPAGADPAAAQHFKARLQELEAQYVALSDLSKTTARLTEHIGSKVSGIHRTRKTTASLSNNLSAIDHKVKLMSGRLRDACSSVEQAQAKCNVLAKEVTSLKIQGPFKRKPASKKGKQPHWNSSTLPPAARWQ